MKNGEGWKEGFPHSSTDDAQREEGRTGVKKRRREKTKKGGVDLERRKGGGGGGGGWGTSDEKERERSPVREI